ncbi:hypothetical protein YC2023_075140 [Brassica napus]
MQPSRYDVHDEDNVPIFKVDDHIGVTIAGLTADGRVFSRYMRSESVNHSFTYEPPLPVGRLVVKSGKGEDHPTLPHLLFTRLAHVSLVKVLHVPS